MQNKELSNEEIALYDRQIRLWGMEAQSRMKTAKVLLINLSAVGTEIAKNLMLGGIGSLTIVDTHDITEQDLNAQFYLDAESLGSKRLTSAGPRIQELNPRVELHCDTETEMSVQNEQFLKNFSLVIATETSLELNLQLNTYTRQLGIPFYCTALNGLSGYIFVDLIEHVSSYKKEQSNVSTRPGPVTAFQKILDVKTSVDGNDTFEHITLQNDYRSLNEVVDIAKGASKSGNNLKETLNSRRKLKKVSPFLPMFLCAKMASYEIGDVDKFKKDCVDVCKHLGIPETVIDNLENENLLSFLQQQNTEFAPVSAIVGGVLAQDVINVLGKKNRPLNNFVILDGLTGDIPIYTI